MTLPDTEYLPISLVCHTVFCPRRTWLEANGEKTDTYQMEAGYSAHRRVDSPGQSRPNELRSLTLRSDTHGLVGKADLVHTDDVSVRLVEYKATPLRKTATVTQAQKVQLALQALCLEESGFLVSGASVRFTDHNRTIPVDLSSHLRETALDYVAQTQEIVESRNAPAPHIDDARCNSCSHLSVCLPDERQQKTVRRRIRAADSGGQLLHVTVPGSRVSLSRGRVRISKHKEELATVATEQVDGIVVHGNIDISAALLRQMLWRRNPVVWCSSTGRVYGWSQPADGPNGASRMRQHVLFQNGYLPIAQKMIFAKLQNQATFLRRNSRTTPDTTILRELARAALECTDINQLFGIEGEGASYYFSNFGGLVKIRAMEKYSFEWVGRRGRGATDPINILLNYAYGMLTVECIRALVSCGLDPHAGVLHSSSRNKPALALDLMEEFRPIVADSAVIGMLNKLAFPLRGFSRNGEALRLSDDGRKAIVRSIENRLEEEFTHPTFGYKVTWRRAIEVQARMLLGVIDGTQPSYKGIVTR